MALTFHHAAAITVPRPPIVTSASRVCILSQLRVIRAVGADRVAFLQGQLTQDLRPLANGDCARFGWTSAQGRLLATGIVCSWQESLWLTVSASTAASVLQRLRLFVLRARVELTLTEFELTGVLTDSGVLQLDGQTLSAEPSLAKRPHAAGTDWLAVPVPGDAARVLLLAAPGRAQQLLGGMTPVSDAEWTAADIRAGLPCIEALTSDQYIPQMLNLDLVDGVSFNKGCYSGQEIITRTRHLGRVKRRQYRLSSSSTVVFGGSVFDHSGEIGRVVCAGPVGTVQELLAVLPNDAVTGPLFADAARTLPLKIEPLPYAIPTE